MDPREGGGAFSTPPISGQSEEIGEVKGGNKREKVGKERKGKEGKRDGRIASPMITL